MTLKDDLHGNGRQRFLIELKRTEVFRGWIDASDKAEAQELAEQDVAEHNGNGGDMTYHQGGDTNTTVLHREPIAATPPAVTSDHGPADS